MKTLKFIFFLLLISQYCFSCSLKQYDYCQIAIGKKCELNASRNLSDNHNNELPVFKRKYKSKGIQVIVPHVSQITIQQFYKPLTFNTPSLINNGIFALHYVESKRGPPLA